MRKENEVIMLGCIMNKTVKNSERLHELINTPLDWAYIAGQLIHHRLLGYFFIGVEKLDRYVMAEFYRSAKLLCRAQRVIALERYELLKPIVKEMEAQGIQYACLKGLVFGVTIYPYEARRSNDCDFLVLESDLAKVDLILRNAGFIQSADKGETEATKKQKFIQRLNYHDLVPYYKKIGSELTDYIKIDINFHIDSKENDITAKTFAYGTEMIEKDEYKIRALKAPAHFMQLCLHFFREATNSLWTSQKRDLLLYKVVDIYNTYNTMSKSDRKESIKISLELNTSKALYFTLYYINKFYPDSDANMYLEEVQQYDLEEISKIYVTGENIYVDREQELLESVFNLTYQNDFSKRRGV